jgi:hypothetical protein
LNLKVNNFLIPTIYLVLLGCNWSRCRTCITSHGYKSWIQSYCAQLLHTKVIWLLIGFIWTRWMGRHFVTWCVYTKLNVEANCCKIMDESCNKKRDDCHCIYCKLLFSNKLHLLDHRWIGCPCAILNNHEGKI